MHSAFVKHMEEYNNVQIYTYGSKMESQVGFAPVLPAQMLNGWLPAAASILTTEMYAIKTVIEEHY